MPIIQAVGESNFGPLFPPPAQQFLGRAKDLHHFWNAQYLAAYTLATSAVYFVLGAAGKSVLTNLVSRKKWLLTSDMSQKKRLRLVRC
jgi:hypothetical protein